MTVEDIIKSALPFAGLPRSPIATDILDICIAFYNMEGKNVWASWPYDEEKIDSII